MVAFLMCELSLVGYIRQVGAFLRELRKVSIREVILMDSSLVLGFYMIKKGFSFYPIKRYNGFVLLNQSIS